MSAELPSPISADELDSLVICLLECGGSKNFWDKTISDLPIEINGHFAEAEEQLVRVSNLLRRCLDVQHGMELLLNRVRYYTSRSNAWYKLARMAFHLFARFPGNSQNLAEQLVDLIEEINPDLTQLSKYSLDFRPISGYQTIFRLFQLTDKTAGIHFIKLLAGGVDDFTQREALEQWSVQAANQFSISPKAFHSAVATKQPESLSYAPTPLSPISAQPAVPLAANICWRYFDVGMIWGLNRGAFIGVLAGLEPDGVWKKFLEVERMLQRTLTQTVIKLPERRWIRMEVTNTDQVPQEQSQVWACAADAHVRESLLCEGLPDNAIPGFIFELEGSACQKNLSDYLSQWCSNVIERVFANSQPAILIQINGDSIRKACDLVRYWPEIISGLPVEKMEIANRQFNEKSIRSRNSSHSLLALPQERTIGACFHTWFVEAVKAAEEHGVKLAERKSEYQAVVAAYQALPKGARVSLDVVHADEVVEDLDRIAQQIEVEGLNGLNWDQNCDRQFLQLVRESLPERCVALVRAYAQSLRSAARREALTFAQRSDHAQGTEYLMDAWVDSRGPEMMSLLQGSDLYATKTGSLIDDLALAVLRQEPHLLNVKWADDWIAGAKRLWSAELRTVDKLRSKKMTDEDFLLSYQSDDVTLELALRAGIRFQISTRVIQSLRLEIPPLWWLLAALPPETERIGALMQLDYQRRAIFGLSTQAEWEECRRDSAITQEIRACRLWHPSV